MKKLVMIISAALFILALVSCSAKVPKSTSSAASSASNKISQDVCFREGTAANGKVIISSNEITAFYPNDSNNRYEIAFKLTDSGKKSLSDETAKLTETGGSISLWIGDKMAVNDEVRAPITDGNPAFSVDSADKVTAICNQLHGKSD